MAEPLGYMFNRTSANPIETDRQVNTITLRDAIPAGKRWRGMLVHVISEDTTYELRGGLLNTNWQEIGGVDATATHYRGDFDATAVDPAISNSNGVEGDEYKVINGGVNVDFGSGDIFLETDDIIIFHNNEWQVKVSVNYGTSYQLPFELATAGQTVINVDPEFVDVNVHINGVWQTKGASMDYTYASGVITMTYTLAENDVIDVRGFKVNASSENAIPPIPNVYADLSDLLVGQPSQIEGYIYEVTDGSGFTGIDSGILWVKYLGTTEGNEDDYSWQPRPDSEYIRIADLSQYADDAAAAVGGVEIGQAYIKSSTGAIHSRLT